MKFKIGDILTHVAAPGSEKMFVVQVDPKWDATQEDCYRCRVFIARAGISRMNIETFHEFELIPFPSEDPAKKLAEHFDVVKEKAVEMADFDLAAKIRDLKVSVIDAMIDINKTKDTP